MKRWFPFQHIRRMMTKKNKWHQMTCFINTSYLVGGFNPFEKYLSKWIISPSRDENKKYLKPPPSYGCQFPKKPDAMRGTALAPPSDRSGAPLGWASLPGDAASPRRCFKRNTLRIKHYIISKSAGLAGVSSGMGLDDGLLVCTLLLLI